MAEMRNAYKILARKPEGKTSLGMPRHRWWIILEWILNRVGSCGLDSSGSEQWPVVPWS
jgi:hypothetical protein